MDYMNTFMIGLNELLRKENFNEYQMNACGDAFELVLLAKQMEWTDRGGMVADIILADWWANGRTGYEKVLLLALEHAYNCGVIDGKRKERKRRCSKEEQSTANLDH